MSWKCPLTFVSAVQLFRIVTYIYDLFRKKTKWAMQTTFRGAFQEQDTPWRTAAIADLGTGLHRGTSRFPKPMGGFGVRAGVGINAIPGSPTNPCSRPDPKEPNPDPVRCNALFAGVSNPPRRNGYPSVRFEMRRLVVDFFSGVAGISRERSRDRMSMRSSR